MIVLHSVTQGHTALKEVWQERIKPYLAAGKKMVIEVRFYEDLKSDEQRRYYHGVVLNTIANEYHVKHSLATWKEFFREKYLGDRQNTYTDPITGELLQKIERISTESLSVAKYAELIEQVTAFAQTELGITIPEQQETHDAQND